MVQLSRNATALEQLLEELADGLEASAGLTREQPGDDIELQEYQRLPPWEDPWDGFLLMGGRGVGKTITGALNTVSHAREWGPILGKDCRIACGAPTIGDARDVMAEGATGLITLFPDEFDYNRSLSEARHVTGAYVKFLGSEEPKRWNGPQWSWLWADELALWKKESWDQAQFGLRLGPHPRWIATTTPKATAFVWDLADEDWVVSRRRSMYDNQFLPDIFKRNIERTYGGTLLGQQEIHAERITAARGALWLRQWIEGTRYRTGTLPRGTRLVRVHVAVDPPATDDPDSSEAGITVCGVDQWGEGYVLEDLSAPLTPDGWGRRAVEAFHAWEADMIVGEINNGGQMVKHTIRTVDANVPFREVRATRGKAIRAQPVAALYEQGRVHHLGIFHMLEDQMCATTPEEWAKGKAKVDRLDSVVWNLSSLMLGATADYDVGEWAILKE